MMYYLFSLGLFFENKLDTRFIFIIHSAVKITHTVKQMFTTI